MGNDFMQRGEISINYDQVYSRTDELKSRVGNELLSKIETDYTRIQSALDDVASSTVASLKENVEAHRYKSIMAANILLKLLAFMSSSAKLMQAEELSMSRDIMTTDGNVRR
jgi:hypothetical protein